MADSKCNDCKSDCHNYTLFNVCTSCFREYLNEEQSSIFTTTAEGIGIGPTLLFYRKMVDEEIIRLQHRQDRKKVLNYIPSLIKRETQAKRPSVNLNKIDWVYTYMYYNSLNVSDMMAMSEETIGDFN